MNFFSTFVTTTAFKYLVAALAGYFASRLGIDQASIEGIISAAVSLVMLVWGAWESSKNKVVLNGERVSLPTSVADNATAKDAKDILIGRVVNGR